jgi:DNA-binding MarR family transcriptional regulator
VDDKKIEEIIENLTALVRLFHLVKNEEQESGIRPLPLDPQYWILLFLLKKDLTMSELGKKLYRSKPNMTAIVDKLIAENLITRLADANDRRVIRIAITDQGRNFIKSRKKEMKEALKSNLANLKEDELYSLGNHLQEMNQIILKIGERKNE